MFDVILCVDKNNGIGLNSRMPWNCPEEMAEFKKTTDGSVLIMGRKTVQYLPKLERRTIVCISRDLNEEAVKNYKNKVILKDSIKSALDFARERYPNKKVFVAGGGAIYELVFTEFVNSIDTIHLSIMKKEYLCDTHVKIPSTFIIDSHEEHDEFSSYKMIKGSTDESQYISLLKTILSQGKYRETRNAMTCSSFVHHMKFDLTKGFPLLTTKKMFWKGIVEELLFFLRGDTNSKLLEEKGINIWKGNTSRKFLDSHGFSSREEGEMGPMYGYQWRRFNGDEKTDQLSALLETLRADPSSRRALMTDFNPLQARDGVLYPCHSIILQFYVDGEYLDMFCYNRSSDIFLGLPFNIASSSLLLSIIAKACKLTPRYFNLTLGDAHIYKDHLKQVHEQMERRMFVLPELEIVPDIYSVTDIEELRLEDFVLNSYKCHPPIKAEMIA
jgi:thymidylate synthase